MPYSSNSELPEAIKNALPVKAQTIYRKAFNSAFETYKGEEEKVIAIAWTAVKTKYEKKDNKWVLKKVKSKVVSGGIAFDPQSEVDEWIPVAKVGQEGLVSPTEQKIVYTKEALENSVTTWEGGNITFNHDPARIWTNEQILDAKFEDPYLYMQLSEAVRAKLKDKSVSGCSIEGVPGEITDEAMLKQIDGSKLTLMEYPLLPACKVEEGCGVVSSSTFEQADVTATVGTDADVSVSSQEAAISLDTEKEFDVFVLNNAGSVVKIGTDAVYGTKKELKDKEYIKLMLMQRGSYYGRDSLQFYEQNKAIKIGDTLPSGSTPVHAMTVVISKQEPELLESDTRHLEGVENIEQSSRGGDVKGMEKEEPITYTGEQVNEMVASAVGEAETNLKNQQEVDINALKEEEKNVKEELETKHTTELKEVGEKSYRKAEAMTAFKAKFNPSEEVLKQAEELDQGAIEFFVGLNIPTQDNPSGVTSAAAEQEEQPEQTVKDITQRFYKKLGRGVVEG
jgi:cation transport regulator